MDPMHPSITADDSHVDFLNPDVPQPGIEETAIAGGETKAKLSPFAKFRQRLRRTPTPRVEDPSQRIGEITAELADLADPVEEQYKRIRERKPEDLQRNAERAINGIRDWYVGERMKTHTSSRIEKILDRIPGRNPETKYRNELRKKAARFHAYYDNDLFSQIEHKTGLPLPDEVDLKSPGTLARENGGDELANASWSGEEDIKMGNTEYVFAAFNGLPSRSFNANGPNYQIESRSGYVVPVDIADLKVPAKMLDTSPGDPAFPEEYNLLKMKLYADNIYKFPDFIQVFSLYTAAIFEKPQDAVDFFRRYGESMDITRAGFWEADVYWGQGGMSEDARAEDNRKLALMIQLVTNKGIFPPFAPEVQYKDKVHAVKKKDHKLSHVM